MIRIHIIVRGVVQGVGFRYYTEKRARAESLAGFVRNCADGSVEIEVQGNEAVINGFIDWVHHGVPRAVVSSVSTTLVNAIIGDEGFSVRG